MHTTKPCFDIRFEKRVDKTEAHIGDCLTYEIRLCNFSVYPLTSVCIKDRIQKGLEIIPTSLYVSKAYEGTLETEIRMLEDIDECDEVIIRFTGIITEQVCKELDNQACLQYEIQKQTNTSMSNVVCTRIYEQHIKELYTSIAYVEAALSSITNVEGAKIQKLVTMADVSTEDLLRLNASVQDVLEIITMFEMVLKRKASIGKNFEVKTCEQEN